MANREQGRDIGLLPGPPGDTEVPLQESLVITSFTFVAVFLAAITWILMDREFATVPSWVLTLREPWNRGAQFSVYGTRALAFATICITLLAIGAQIVLLSPTAVSRFIATTFTATAIVSLAICIPLAAKLHHRKYVASLIYRIQEQIDVHSFTDTANLSPLDYACADDWTAWQINHPAFPSPTNIAYVSADESCVVFSGDLQSFLCWQPSAQLRIGELLPFDGPLESHFRIERIERFPRFPNWVSMNCRLESISLGAGIRETMS